MKIKILLIIRISNEMVSSVEEKMMMTQYIPIKKNNDNKMVKKMGFNGSEIRRMGISNQKIKRRMG